jgi:hypothetical protein
MHKTQFLCPVPEHALLVCQVYNAAATWTVFLASSTHDCIGHVLATNSDLQYMPSDTVPYTHLPNKHFSFEGEAEQTKP